MNKNEQLDLLFEEWITKYHDYKGKWKKDGIINEVEYNKQKIKVLLIAKEPNDTKEEEGDFRDWWNSEVKYSFSHRIAEWAYGIANNFPLIDTINYENNNQLRIAALKTIAFMNLKKIGGGAIANYDIIKKTIESEKDFIIREIEIISPDIIIGCIGEFSYWHLLFGDDLNVEKCYDCNIFRYKNIKVINYYHPSYRVPRAMLYCLLGNIFNSEKFKRL